MSSIKYCECCGVINQVSYITAAGLDLRLCGREYHMYNELTENPKIAKADTIYKKNFHSYDEAAQFWENFKKKPYCYHCGDTTSKKYFHVFFDRVICSQDNLMFTQMLREEGYKEVVDAFTKNYVLKDNVIVKLSSLQSKNNSNQINGTEQLDRHPKETDRYSNATLTPSQDASSTRMLFDESIDSKKSEDTLPSFYYLQQINSDSGVTATGGEQFECLDMAVEGESVNFQEALNPTYTGTRDDYNFISIGQHSSSV